MALRWYTVVIDCPDIARLLEAGASRVDVGQGDDVTWTVLADPRRPRPRPRR
ncbi:MAG TPA: hypothetical protein VFG97_10190 [Pedococcus sp.]|nr:hypothetical protein [Pedococcus sp.]